LDPSVAAKRWASFGVTEPHGGSDVAQIKARAREDGDDFVLDGSKVFSTNASTPLHGMTTVVAVTDPDNGPKGLSTFAVAGRHAGILDRQAQPQDWLAHRAIV